MSLRSHLPHLQANCIWDSKWRCFGIREGGFHSESLPAFEMGSEAIGLNDEPRIPSDSCLLNICSPCRGQLGFAKLHEMNREKLQKIWKECTTEYRGQVRECFPPQTEQRSRERRPSNLSHVILKFMFNTWHKQALNMPCESTTRLPETLNLSWEWVFCVFQKTAYKSRSEKWLPPGCNLLPHKDQGKGSRWRACSMAHAWVWEVNLGRSMHTIVFCP